MNSKPLSEAKEKRRGEGVIGANSSLKLSNHARSTPGPPSLQMSGWEPRLSEPLGGCEAVACFCDPGWTLSPLPSTQKQDKSSCFQHHHVPPSPGVGVLPPAPYTPGLQGPLAWEDVRGSGDVPGVAHSPLVAEPGLDTVSPPDRHTDAVLDGSHLSPHCDSTDLENCTSAKVAPAPHLERLSE